MTKPVLDTTLAPDEIANPEVDEQHIRTFNLRGSFRQERKDDGWEYFDAGGRLIAEAYLRETGTRWHCKLCDWRSSDEPTLDAAIRAARACAGRDVQRWRERFLGRREGYARGLAEGKALSNVG